MNRLFGTLTWLILSGLPVAASARDPLEGVWRNRPNTVAVRIAPCGRALCGIVVGASSDAKARAREGGAPNLVGAQVLSGVRASSGSGYTGEVYNPDLSMRAQGTITLVSPTVLIVRACVLAGLICRQQHWTRIG